MPGYQNYYQPMNQQQNYMQNQNLQQMSYSQNPYAQQQYQGTFQGFNAQVQGLSGRYLDDFGTITANDVPMTGNPAVFIKNDGSEIQLRLWTPQGTIATTRYSPITDVNGEQCSNIQSNDLNALNDDMRAFREELNARFDKLEKSLTAKSSTRIKKEVSADE